MATYSGRLEPEGLDEPGEARTTEGGLPRRAGGLAAQATDCALVARRPKEDGVAISS